MMNDLNESPEWTTAGTKITEQLRYCMNRGSGGIAEWVEKYRALWSRYNSGERTEDLLNSINAIPNLPKESSHETH